MVLYSVFIAIPPKSLSQCLFPRDSESPQFRNFGDGENILEADR